MIMQRNENKIKSKKCISLIRITGQVTDVLLNDLTTQIPHDKYVPLCNKLLPDVYDRVITILAKHGRDHQKATRECFGIWKDKSERSSSELARILQEVELGGVWTSLAGTQ